MIQEATLQVTLFGENTVTCVLTDEDRNNLARLVGHLGWGNALRMALEYAYANLYDMMEAFGEEE